MEIINWMLLFFSLFYMIISTLSIRWIVRQDIMNRFQKAIHILMSLLFPLLWFYLIKMIYKPIPGYKKRKWFDNDSDGGYSGGATDYGSHGDGGVH